MDYFKKYTVFRSHDDGQVYAVRNVPPRLTCRFSPGGETSDIVFTDFEDGLPPDPVILAKMMGGIGRAVRWFLIEEKTKKNDENSK